MIKEWKDSTLKRFIQEGRGAGDGKEYKPWLQVQDVKSRGRSTRIFSQKTQRVMHLLSDLQLHYYYLLEFDEAVIDIREHYPLLDLHEQNLLFDAKLQKKLFNAKTNMPHIFTTTFYVTKVNAKGEPYYEARVIKSSSELDKPATIERLQIMYSYFNKKEIDFGIVTEKDINKQKALNIGWFMTTFDLTDFPEIEAIQHYLRADLFKLFKVQGMTFTRAFTRLEKTYQLIDGSGLTLFKHLLATKQLVMNLNNPIELTDCVSVYDIRINETDGGRDAISG
ncbi:TnsA endonuclease C-terminal domain-containing protein [Lysinibacillus sp. FSL H8-0500]|uniref:TnsA endonuclease C-terminal domain-containing protein n=1 Tax=Lysinibacillus sp. FSL H8-0500 TaxID=2921393 RepID=UPI003100DE40